MQDATIDSVIVTGSVAKAYVSYRRLGFAQGNPAGFTEALADTKNVLEMVHLEDGWWLNSASPPHILASTIVIDPTFNGPHADSLRHLIERLARSRDSL